MNRQTLTEICGIAHGSANGGGGGGGGGLAIIK